MAGRIARHGVQPLLCASTGSTQASPGAAQQERGWGRTCMSGAGMPLPSCAKRVVTSPSGLNSNMRALFTTSCTSPSVPLQAARGGGTRDEIGTEPHPSPACSSKPSCCLAKREWRAASAAQPQQARGLPGPPCQPSLDLRQVAPAARGIRAGVEGVPQPGAAPRLRTARKGVALWLSGARRRTQAQAQSNRRSTWEHWAAPAKPARPARPSPSPQSPAAPLPRRRRGPAPPPAGGGRGRGRTPRRTWGGGGRVSKLSAASNR